MTLAQLFLTSSLEEVTRVYLEKGGKQGKVIVLLPSILILSCMAEL